MKGALAKEYAVKKIAEAFGSDFVGEFDKKVYINCPENGEMVQIAIAMTCPKKTIGAIGAATPDGGYSNTLDFDNDSPSQPVVLLQPRLPQKKQKILINFWQVQDYE